MIFECNLPRKIPDYYHPFIRSRLKETVERVYMRTDKLNEAFEISKLSFGTFHHLARDLFQWYSDPEKGNDIEAFDALTPRILTRKIKERKTKKEYPSFVEWPNVTVLYDTAFVTTQDWELLRHFGVGGSDSSVLMGVSHYNSLEGLYLDKIGVPEIFKDPGKQTVFDRGHYMENTVLNNFCTMTGAERIPETRMFQNKRYPWITANLDGIFRMPDGSFAIGEAKTATDVYNVMVEWKNGNIPAKYITQITQYMGTMDDPRLNNCWIICLPVQDTVIGGEYVGSEITGKPRMVKMERDREFEEELFEMETDFWKNYIEQNVKPAPSLNAKLDKEIAKRFIPSPVTNPEAPNKALCYEEFENVLKKLQSAEEETTAAKKKLEQVENTRNSLRLQITTAMEDAQLADFKDDEGNIRFQVKNTLVVKDRVKTKDLKLYFPDVFEKCGYQSSETRFSMREILQRQAS